MKTVIVNFVYVKQCICSAIKHLRPHLVKNELLPAVTSFEYRCYQKRDLAFILILIITVCNGYNFCFSYRLSYELCNLKIRKYMNRVIYVEHFIRIFIKNHADTELTS